MSIKISQVKRDELPQIVQLLQSAYQMPRSIEQVQGYFAEQYTILGAYKADQLIGVAILLWLPDEAELLDIVIEPECQGQGLGQQLLNYVIDQVRQRSKKTLFLEVRASNERAIALYKKRGFQPIHIRKQYYPPLSCKFSSSLKEKSGEKSTFEDAIVMRFTL